jgi:mono/diheme cytochrome c family protein
MTWSKAKVRLAMLLIGVGGVATYAGCTAFLPPGLYPAAWSSGGSTGATATLSFVGDVVPILKSNCAACHTAGGPGAVKVLMFDAAGVPQYTVVRSRIRDMLAAIKDGRMPRGKPGSVPADQVATLLAWANQGAPELAGNGGAGVPTVPGASIVTSRSAGGSVGPATAASSVVPVAGVPSFEDVVPVLREHCAACHVTGGIGPFAMFDAAQNPQYDVVKQHLDAMIAAIQAKRMPLDKPGSVPDAQVALLLAWQAAGAPQFGSTPASGGSAGIGSSSSPTLAPSGTPPSGTPLVTPNATLAPATLPPIVGAVGFSADVVPVLREHCIACHVTGGIGPFAMFDASHTPQYGTIKSHIDAMIAAIQANRMPLGKPGTVRADQVAILLAWQAAGAPPDSTPGATPTTSALAPTPTAGTTPTAPATSVPISTSTPISIPTHSPMATPAPTGTPAPAGTASAAPVRTAASFAYNVVPVLRQHCAACHVTGGIGPFAMFDKAGTPQYSTVKSQIGNMIQAIVDGVMPLGAPGSLTAAEIQALRDWQNVGAPNN